jgi:cell division septum initiation protein DivIVA
MSVELQADDEAARPWSAGEKELRTEPLDRRRPNVSGDLPTVFQAAPMFRRAVAGYDRFQVDTYVQWAEDELATAEREREHLLARQLRTQAALEESRQLLAHSSAGGEFLHLSRRIGSMLAAAADEADSMRADADSMRAEAARVKAEAETRRSAASAQAKGMLVQAQRVLDDAEAEAEQMVARAATEIEAMTAEGGRMLAEAQAAGRKARAQAEARLDKVQVIEQRATEHAGQIRQQAQEEAAAIRLRARDEAIRLLSTAREQRRRADAEATAARERLDQIAAARSASLLAEVEALEHRRVALRTEVELLAEEVADTSGGRVDVHLRRLLERLRGASRSLRTP